MCVCGGVGVWVCGCGCVGVCVWVCVSNPVHSDSIGTQSHWPALQAREHCLNISLISLHTQTSPPTLHHLLHPLSIPTIPHPPPPPPPLPPHMPRLLLIPLLTSSWRRGQHSSVWSKRQLSSRGTTRPSNRDSPAAACLLTFHLLPPQMNTISPPPLSQGCPHRLSPLWVVQGVHRLLTHCPSLLLHRTQLKPQFRGSLSCSLQLLQLFH